MIYPSKLILYMLTLHDFIKPSYIIQKLNTFILIFYYLYDYTSNFRIQRQEQAIVYAHLLKT